MKLRIAGTLALAVAYGAYKLLSRKSSYSFRGRGVFISGGSRGLGLVLARQLVEEGAQVALMARDQAELQRAAAELEQRGGTVITIAGDVTEPGAVAAAVQFTTERFGRLDVVINNAGLIQTGPAEHMALHDFQQALAVHLWAPLYTIAAALPHLRKQPGARVVNVSSIGGKLAVPHLLPYCASKFALAGLSSGLRAELARYGVLVTTVYPGLMRTGSHRNALFKGKQEQEYLWFALSDSLPLLTNSAESAAAQILEACGRGDAELVIGWPYRLAARLAALMPETVGKAMVLVNGLLPGPTGPDGDTAWPGWASSGLTPSLLTILSDRAARANNEVPDSA